MDGNFFLDEQGLRARPLLQFDWLDHNFGTRHSAIPEPIATVKQIHSVLIQPHVGGAGCLAEADAITSNTAGVPLGVKTADCLPVLVVDPEHRAIAAIHAGWRGVAGGIVPLAIQQMRERFDSVPSQLVIAIGPGIGACCFEVGPEVAVEFGRRGRSHVDLIESVWRQLSPAGVTQRNVYSSGLCTVCNPALFHSFRRDREAAGRMMSVIGIKKDAARPEQNARHFDALGS